MARCCTLAPRLTAAPCLLRAAPRAGLALRDERALPWRDERPPLRALLRALLQRDELPEVLHCPVTRDDDDDLDRAGERERSLFGELVALI